VKKSPAKAKLPLKKRQIRKLDDKSVAKARGGNDSPSTVLTHTGGTHDDEV
jgi:hypothetical protein